MEIRVKKAKLKAKRLLPVLIIALAAAAFAWVNAAFAEPLMGAASERAADISSRVLNAAVAEAVASADTRSLLELENTGGETFVITVDTASLNAVTSSAAEKAQAFLSESGRAGVGIELGSVSGVALLSGRGPVVRAGFTPIGSVASSVGSRLRSSGINQSLFTVELTLTARIRLVIAGKTEVITVKNTVPVCETVVVGSVPQVYTNVADEEDMLNLIPNELP